MAGDTGARGSVVVALSASALECNSARQLTRVSRLRHQGHIAARPSGRRWPGWRSFPDGPGFSGNLPISPRHKGGVPHHFLNRAVNVAGTAGATIR